jgi:pilus assembly protein Flp/PilA
MRNLIYRIHAKWLGRGRERGAALTEYGILLALIAAVVIGVISTLGDEIKTVFDRIVQELQA